ncbi:MAG: RHS repeat-associated core domain-containing protein [Chitinophagaceae bacterium]|nr:RHS repeat-associated core domain-containing protein [Chitinophagaceae bacterium]
MFESRTISPADPSRPDYADKLLFISQPEGRLRTIFEAADPNVIKEFVDDYFVKDHLGNVRMALTDEVKQDIYPAATLEGDINTNGSPNAAYIEKSYYTIDATKIADKPAATGITDYPNHNGNPPVNNNPNSNTTAGSEKLYQLKATATEGVAGLGITLKVMAGDKIDIFGKSYYFNAVTNGATQNQNIATLSILTGLLGGPTGGTAAGAHGGVTGTQLNGIGNTTGGILSLFDDQLDEVPNSSAKPRAFINYIFFDEQFKSVSSGFDAVGDKDVVKSHQLTGIAASKNGYVYIYASNQSQVPVFFDNFQVIHTRGAILEETHYYPYGMKMAGISSKAYGSLKNPYQYQGDYNDFDDETGWNNFELRNYDPQTGRFIQQDPYDQFPSPYTGMGNNPINNIDEDGGWSAGLTGSLIGAAAIGVSSYLVAKNNGASDLESAGIGIGGALLGAGLGYATGQTWFGSEGGLNFVQNFKGFYMGALGSKAAYTYGSGVLKEEIPVGKVPNIWGGINMPDLKFGWEYTGTLERSVPLQTIHLMGVADYVAGRYLKEEMSVDPDVKVYGASGTFNIPSVENGTNVLNVTSSPHSSGRDIAKLNGNIITGNVNLGSGSTKIKLDADPNVDPNQQLKAYVERKRQAGQYGKPFNYHDNVLPGLDFSINQYQTRGYLKQHYYFFGIRTIRKLSRQ